MFAREAIREITQRVRALARQQSLDEVYVDEEATTAIRCGPVKLKLENDNGEVMLHRRGTVPVTLGRQFEEADVLRAAETIVRTLRDPSSGM